MTKLPFILAALFLASCAAPRPVPARRSVIDQHGATKAVPYRWTSERLVENSAF